MRELPDDDRLRIMAQVATTCALEGQGDAYTIFARLLYQYLTDTQPFCTSPNFIEVTEQ